MTALEVRNIQKNYGKTEVLKDISFSLEKGQEIGRASCRERVCLYV